jgi:hypothetical protein
MQILRLPPYPLSVSYTVPESNQDYVLVIEDTTEQSEVVVYLTSNSSSKITYTLDGDFVKYDKSYSLTVYEDLQETGNVIEDRGDIVVQDNLEIARPYVNPTELATKYGATTASEIAKYEEYESLARVIIDSITGGFYYKRQYVEPVGQETDYMPVWEKVEKLIRVYENAILVYDVTSADGPALGEWNYLLTKDKSAIIKDPVAATDGYNRSERRPARVPLAASDSLSLFDTDDSGNVATITPGVTFPAGTDYIFLAEVGYKVVPYDIQDATKMLIEDIKCGKLDYYKRYVKNYSTDQFKIEYDKEIFSGTGNIIVDKILSNYTNKITRIGIL